MLREDELTSDEQWLYMPKWRKILIGIFIALLPLIGSVQSINF